MLRHIIIKNSIINLKVENEIVLEKREEKSKSFPTENDLTIGKEYAILFEFKK